MKYLGSIAFLLCLASTHAQTAVRLYLQDGSELVATVDHDLKFKTELGVFDLSLDRLSHVRRSHSQHAILFSNGDMLTGEVLNDITAKAFFGTFVLKPADVDELVVGAGRSALHSDWSAPVGGMAIRMLAEKPGIRFGENFTLTVQLKNMSKESLVFPELEIHDEIRTVEHVRKRDNPKIWISVDYEDGTAMREAMERVMEAHVEPRPLCLLPGGVFQLTVLVDHQSGLGERLERLQEQQSIEQARTEPKMEISRVAHTKFNNLQGAGALTFRAFLKSAEEFPRQIVEHRIWNHELISPAVVVEVSGSAK